MNVGSLFSGAGGLDLGYEAEGFNIVWFVESDPYARAIIRKHWPNAVIYDDITQVDFRKVQPVDGIIGGPPCQDISNAGKRAGITGSRSSLWKYYLKAARILRPKWFQVENVSALTKRGLNVVLADIASIGFDAEWHCISASSVGAPHRRDRIFIIAYSHSKRQFHRQIEVHATSRGGETQFDAQQICATASDYWSQRISGSIKKETRKLPTFSWCKDFRSIEDWGRFAAISPSVICRSYDGISAAIPRIKCAGNAVVPQVAQVIAKAIKEVEYDRNN